MKIGEYLAASLGRDLGRLKAELLADAQKLAKEIEDGEEESRIPGVARSQERVADGGGREEA